MAAAQIGFDSIGKDPYSAICWSTLACAEGSSDRR
jgi:hypothetical protein